MGGAASFLAPRYERIGRGACETCACAFSLLNPPCEPCARCGARLCRRCFTAACTLHVPCAPGAVLALPFSLLALFGLYSLASIAHGLASFEDISAAKLELDREVLEVRAELKARGVRSIAELRAAAGAGGGGGKGGAGAAAGAAVGGAGGSRSAKKAR